MYYLFCRILASLIEGHLLVKEELGGGRGSGQVQTSLYYLPIADQEAVDRARQGMRERLQVEEQVREGRREGV